MFSARLLPERLSWHVWLYLTKAFHGKKPSNNINNHILVTANIYGAYALPRRCARKRFYYTFFFYFQDKSSEIGNNDSISPMKKRRCQALVGDLRSNTLFTWRSTEVSGTPSDAPPPPQEETINWLSTYTLLSWYKSIFPKSSANRLQRPCGKVLWPIASSLRKRAFFPPGKFFLKLGTSKNWAIIWVWFLFFET